MAYSNPQNEIATILLDIEGTTTPIDFVYKTLFPYARAHMSQFIVNSLHGPELSEDLPGLLREHKTDVDAGSNPPPISEDQQSYPESLVEYIYWLMDRDRKSTPLKSIQGKIWEAGYAAGELKSEVFPDVPRAFERWAGQGRQLCIYSSGSVLAQKLLFANTQAGDLTRFISGYFDTSIGPKKEPNSYSRIAAQLHRQAAEIFFISDTTAELVAANQAGLSTVLCFRPGNQPQPATQQYSPATQQYSIVETFDDVFRTQDR